MVVDSSHRVLTGLGCPEYVGRIVNVVCVMQGGGYVCKCVLHYMSDEQQMKYF